MSYGRSGVAAKQAYAALGSKTHPGRVAKPPPAPEFFCLECRARIPHDQAAAHAARCRKRP